MASGQTNAFVSASVRIPTKNQRLRVCGKPNAEVHKILCETVYKALCVSISTIQDKTFPESPVTNSINKTKPGSNRPGKF